MNAPTGICAGETLLICGIGFHTATELEPLTVAFAVSIAEIVIVSGEGSVAGAVYTPLVEIVPTVAFPPATPFTDHVSVSFVIDGTNVCVEPTRTSAELGEIVNVVLSGGGALVVATGDIAQLAIAITISMRGTTFQRRTNPPL